MGKFRSRRAAQWMVVPLLAAGSIVALGGVAMAVSAGNYQPSEQDCSKTADAYNNDQTAEPGCHTFKLNVESGGTRYAEVGIDQMPNGPSTPGLLGVGYPGSDNFPHSGCVAVNTNGTGGAEGNNCGNDIADPNSGTGVSLFGNANNQDGNDVVQTGAPDAAGLANSLATNGADVYMGADDNLDAGEHDGVDNQPSTGTDGNANGPSDGGAVRAFVHPGDATVTPSSSDPVPFAGASFGSCADGICEEVTTYRQAIYQGGGDGSRDVTNYDGKSWDPYNFSSGSYNDEEACFDSDHPHGMNDYRNDEGTVYAEPGVQVYEDPDPQASPIDPIYEFEQGAGISDGSTPLYPLPGTYVGTCGVNLQGATVLANPAEAC